MVVVLVCGGRNYNDIDFLEKTLDDLAEKYRITKLIHGEAKGADMMANDWAFSRDIPRRGYRAKWEKHGNSAGPIRNQQMLDEGQPELVVAFPGGSGTRDMTTRAKKAGIKVLEVG
jgi:YspA, cpYpsA-related SLOG family